MMRGLGIELIAANSPNSFVGDTPTAIMVRQILGAMAQFEKARPCRHAQRGAGPRQARGRVRGP